MSTDRVAGLAVGRNGLTEGDLLVALMEDETKLGRPHTPGERDAFARGFFSTEYGDEIRLLMTMGVTDPEDGPEGAD